MQSLLSKDYFELFGLPVSFEVDVERLIEQYRELQHTVHPDKFVNASDQERRLSMQTAAQINEAFQTLKSPLSRARYLLQQQGVSMDNENADLGHEFLIEQMELRERLDALRSEPNSQVPTEKLLGEIKQTIDGLQDEFKLKFNGGNSNTLAEAATIYHKMQFLVRIREEVDNLVEGIS